MGDDTSLRPGSGQDVSRRLDRLEQNHADLSGRVTMLSGAVERVELNQKHAEELNKLRFDALDAGVKTIDSTLERFMSHIVAWREGVDSFLAQGKLLGRIVVLLVSSNLIAITAAIFAAMK